MASEAERSMMADKICELQHKIDEYERFMGDLLVMMSKGEPQCVVVHECGTRAEWIWDYAKKIIAENKCLNEQLAQFSHVGEA